MTENDNTSNNSNNNNDNNTKTDKHSGNDTGERRVPIVEISINGLGKHSPYKYLGPFGI